MMSVQSSGVLQAPRLATCSCVGEKDLAAIDNEICLEKIHFNFLPETNSLKD